MNANEAWALDALAEQEEHIKRSLSCQEQVGRAHKFQSFGWPGAEWSACAVCKVTETAADYALSNQDQRR